MSVKKGWLTGMVMESLSPILRLVYTPYNKLLYKPFHSLFIDFKDKCDKMLELLSMIFNVWQMRRKHLPF